MVVILVGRTDCYLKNYQIPGCLNGSRSFAGGKMIGSFELMELWKSTFDGLMFS